jgi:hypothetical protein
VESVEKIEVEACGSSVENIWKTFHFSTKLNFSIKANMENSAFVWKIVHHFSTLFPQVLNI